MTYIDPNISEDLLDKKDRATAKRHGLEIRLRGDRFVVVDPKLPKGRKKTEYVGGNVSALIINANDGRRQHAENASNARGRASNGDARNDTSGNGTPASDAQNRPDAKRARKVREPKARKANRYARGFAVIAQSRQASVADIAKTASLSRGMAKGCIDAWNAAVHVLEEKKALSVAADKLLATGAVK